MTRRKRKPVTEACIQYAIEHGAVPASKKFGNAPSSINDHLRKRGLGRGVPKANNDPKADPALFRWHAERILDKAGYVSPLQVRNDLEKFGVTIRKNSVPDAEFMRLPVRGLNAVDSRRSLRRLVRHPEVTEYLR